MSIIPFAALTLVFGPLVEEPGWRGFALDHLQTKLSATSASLILGLVWGLWHMPLFFMSGTYQHDVLGTSFIGFSCLNTVAQSVLLTWAYSNTRRSTTE